MSTESPPEAVQKSKPKPSKTRVNARDDALTKPPWSARLADACLIALFLTLTFLLGVFPLKDADIYWHLKTGDWIRQMGQVPRFDLFTWERGPSVPWIDLHWLFQIAVSWVYQQGGVIALNLAKCVVTCVAMLVLLTARNREWPLSVMVLAWLPALLVLGGRIYVRPETLTLLYLSIFLAVIFRWERYPWLALLLPVVQVAWVNSQGLFVLGPILVAFGLIDAALRFGFFDPERRRWWRMILAASLLTGAACLINPYLLTGALYPLELAGTMSNPIFSHNIAELTPIPDFILAPGGIRNLPMQLHLATMTLGALSFLIPLAWLIKIRVTSPRPLPSAGTVPALDSRERTSKAKKNSRSTSATTTAQQRKQSPAVAADQVSGWRLSPFRLLLFVAFSLLSLQATRNSHQFAAVVGTVTAWNFGEWAAFARRRRLTSDGASPISSAGVSRLVSFGAVTLVLVWVGSGLFYKMTGEGRVIDLAEDPLFFPHEAARFAGRPEMPKRFLSFHNAHAALFEYYHGPERKVYTDPRLEVAGALLFKRYSDLEKLLKKDLPGWEAQLNEMGRPVILVDHEYNWDIGATLFRSAHWRCVWFDAIAAVFVHDSNTSVVREHAIDFAARHFHPDPSAESRSIAELAASSKAFRSYAPAVGPPGSELGRPFFWLGLDDARRLLRRASDSSDGWKYLGQIELSRELPTEPVARFRMPFDPVLDLSMVRATYALRRALERAPHDFSTLRSMQIAYDYRLMNEAALPVLDRLASLHPTNASQLSEQAKNEAARPEYVRKLGSPSVTTWRNLSELDQRVTDQLAAGRVESAADLLERAYPPEKASWEIIDKMASLRLHLGEPARARELWRKATTISQPGIKDARIGTTYLIEGDFDTARRHYQQALDANPNLFEAHYCLAVIEQESARARPAYEQASLALKAARDDSARSAARAIAAGVARFARVSNVEDVPAQ
jgi:tetratricopeptide (TPR) repeat protein